MTWTMPPEWAPQDRLWMAFPRVGNTLGDDAESADEARDAWAAVANAVAGFEPVTMVVDPSARRRGPAPALGRDRAARGAARRLLDARHRTHLRHRRRRRARRGRLDLQRLGRERVGDLGARRQDRRLRRRGGRRRAPPLAARQRGRRDPRRRRGHRAAHRDRAARSAAQPLRHQGARGVGAAPHAPRDELHLAAARPHPRLRVGRHPRPRRHGRLVRAARRRPAALAGRPVAPRLRGRAAGPRRARRGDGCRGPPSRVHRAPRSRDTSRRRRLRRLELRQPPRRQRRRDRLRLRRARRRRPRRRHPRRRVRPRGRDDRRATDPRAGRRHPLHHPAAAVVGTGFPVVERAKRDETPAAGRLGR